jgi:hypothetical protein
VSQLPQLHIIDWEFAQCNHRSIDLGQFVGDLLESAHFAPAAQRQTYHQLLRGFVKGYGRVNESLALRTIVHAGVHIINWCSRHAPPYGELFEQVEELVEYASELIVRAWTKDVSWFRTDISACLFE